MQELASEFICFMTSEANDQSLAEGRRSITTSDFSSACIELDLAEMAQLLNSYIELHSKDLTIGTCQDEPDHPSSSSDNEDSFVPKASSFGGSSTATSNESIGIHLSSVLFPDSA